MGAVSARESAACALCGQTGRARWLSARDPDGLAPEPFGISLCPDCGVGYVNPRPPASELPAFYVRGYYGRPGEDSGFLGRWLARALMAERVAKASRGLARGRVLDVGCGDGTFLAAMRRRGWDCWGVEVSREGAARAAAREGLRIVSGPLEGAQLPEGSFDLVTLWHSVEHVADPAALIARAAGLLKDGGRLFVAFPNVRSWDLVLFGSRWFHLDPPRHLHYFSPEAMTRLLERNGLVVERLSHWSLEYNPWGLIQSGLNLSTREMNYLYRLLKGTLPAGGRSSYDLFATILLFPLLALLALPYTLLAAAGRRSGCVDLRAVARKARAPRGAELGGR